VVFNRTISQLKFYISTYSRQLCHFLSYDIQNDLIAVQSYFVYHKYSHRQVKVNFWPWNSFLGHMPPYKSRSTSEILACQFLKCFLSINMIKIPQNRNPACHPWKIWASRTPESHVPQENPHNSCHCSPHPQFQQHLHQENIPGIIFLSVLTRGINCLFRLLPAVI